MATLLETLLVKLALDATDYDSSLKGAQSSLDGFSEKAKSIGGTLSLAVTAPIVAVGAASLGMASDLNESMSKVDVVFGDNADQIVKWSQDSADSFGLSQQAALESAGTFGNLFTAMGLNSDASQEMSTNIVGLAADLASFNNIGTDEALEKLRAGLVGEAEPLRTLGVNLSAAAIKSQALKMGLADVVVDEQAVTKATIDAEQAAKNVAKAIDEHGASSLEARDANAKYTEAVNKLTEAQQGTVQELTAGQKAQAAYALIMEQTRLAQGDFARTSDGLANQQRILKAEFADVSAQLGQQLLPIAVEVAHGLSDLLGWFKGLSPETQHWIVIIAGIAAAAGPVIAAIGLVASGISAVITVLGAASAAVPVLGAALAVLTGPIGIIVAAVAALAVAWSTDFLGIRETTEGVIGWISGAWPGFVDGLQSKWASFTGWLQQTDQSTTSTIQSTWQSFTGWLSQQTQGALQTVQGYWQNHSQSVQSIAENQWGSLRTIIQMHLDAIRGITQAGVQFMQGDWQGGLQTLQSTAEGLFGSLQSIFQNQLDSVRNLFEMFGWGDVGDAIIRGIGDGISNGIGYIENAAQDAARAALDAAKSWLGIGSPSKVAAAELGQPFTEGVGMGAVQALPSVTDRIQGALDSMIGGLSLPEPAMAAQGVGGGGMQINVYLNGSATYDDGRRAGQGIADELRARGLA